MPSRPHRLLFVCSGNICRSPIAAAIALDRATKTTVEMEVQSASTLGLVDRPAEPGMVKVASELGLDLSAHRSQPVSDELVRWADQILVMEFAHVAHLEDAHPGARGRIALLGRRIGVDEIADPIGSWFTFRYRRTRDQLVRAVHDLVDHLPSEVEE